MDTGHRYTTCTLSFLDDKTVEYTDDSLHWGLQPIRGNAGEDPLTVGTARLLTRWVEEYDSCCRRDEFEVLGLHLYYIAFGSRAESPVRFAFERTVKKFEEDRKRETGRRLRLRLEFHQGVTQLVGFPWEFLFMPPTSKEGKGVFLAGQDTELVLTRLVATPKDFTPPEAEEGEGTLRILLVLSQPEKLPMLGADDLVKEIMALRSPDIDVGRLDNPDRDALSTGLKEFRPHIIHFIGHGKEDGKLALLKSEKLIQEAKSDYEASVARGESPAPVEYADWINKDTVSQLFVPSQNPPRLVFLHACKGADIESLRGSVHSLSSTALELAYSKVPAVVAMQYEISNEDAQRFAIAFYRSIREGNRLDEAVNAARRKLVLGSTRDAWASRNFGTPVIYLQSDAPIILPPPLKPVDSEGVKVDKTIVDCPYVGCNGRVQYNRKFCPDCQRAIAPCPNPDCAKDHIMIAQEKGICTACGHKLEPSPIGTLPTAPPKSPSAPQPQGDRLKSQISGRW